MKKTQKITVEVPSDVLKNAMAFSHEGITPTVTKALQYFSSKQAAQELLKLRKKVKLGLSYKDIKEMR